MEIIRTSVDMPKELWLTFKSICAKKDLKMRDELEIMISKWLMKHQTEV